MKNILYLLFIILTAFFAISCGEEEEDYDKVVGFTGISQQPSILYMYERYDPSTLADMPVISKTKYLNLYLSEEINGLTVDDIIFDAGDTGAIKGDLLCNSIPEEGHPITYNLFLKNVYKSGFVNVAILKQGYYISLASIGMNAYEKITEINGIRGYKEKLYYFFDANIPTGLAAEWYISPDNINDPERTPQYTIKSDGTLLVNNQDNKLQVSVSKNYIYKNIITFYNDEEEAGTAKFSISDTTLTITEASSGMVIINGTYHKKADS